MQQAIEVLLYVLTFVASLASLTPVVANDKNGMEAIVHKNDLQGWQVEGTARFDDKTGQHPVWTVANGEVSCAGHGFGFLRYDKQLADFVVSLEFKAGPDTNSGIGLRGIKYSDKDLNTRPSIAGFEVQILDDASKQPTVDSSGALYRYIAPKKNAIRNAGEWNQLVITCLGPKIVVE